MRHRHCPTGAAALAAVVVISVASVATHADVYTNVTPVAPTELNGYTLLYDMNLPAAGGYNGVTFNNVPPTLSPGSFSRVAYYLELTTGTGPTATTQWVYTSMNSFVRDPAKVGIPTPASGAVFQREVKDLNVYSNVSGVSTGAGRSGYNIEFWPTDYSASNARSVPNTTSTSAYDWGDTRTATGGHGSMQIHDHAGSKTVFGWSNWGSGSSTTNSFGLGIGSRPTSHPDWTFAANSGSYSARRMQVLVGGPAQQAPALGTGAPAHVYQNVPEASGMIHLQTLQIPGSSNRYNNYAGVPYSVDNSLAVAPGSFNRVGYYLELQPTGGTEADTKWVFVSMDAFTTDPTKVGLPNIENNVLFQRNVSNMNVASNGPGVTTGTGIQTGSIEMWPSSYSAAKTAGTSPANASDTAFDFGDSGAALTAGHASFQVHNYDIDGPGPGTAGQTIFAINDWGGNAAGTNVLELGIGNNASGNPDWTHADNVASYTVRNLYVFVQPVPEPASSLAAVGGALVAMRRQRRNGGGATP